MYFPLSQLFAASVQTVPAQVKCVTFPYLVSLIYSGINQFNLYESN